MKAGTVLPTCHKDAESLHLQVQHCLAAENQHSEPEGLELVSHFLELALSGPGPFPLHLSTSVSRSIKPTLSTNEDQVR